MDFGRVSSSLITDDKKITISIDLEHEEFAKLYRDVERKRFAYDWMELRSPSSHIAQLIVDHVIDSLKNNISLNSDKEKK